MTTNPECAICHKRGAFKRIIARDSPDSQWYVCFGHSHCMNKVYGSRAAARSPKGKVEHRVSVLFDMFMEQYVETMNPKLLVDKYEPMLIDAASEGDMERVKTIQAELKERGVKARVSIDGRCYI